VQSGQKVNHHTTYEHFSQHNTDTKQQDREKMAGGKSVPTSTGFVGGGGPVGLLKAVAELKGWITNVCRSDPIGLLPVWNAVLNNSNVEKVAGTKQGLYTNQYPGDLSANPKATYLHYEQCNYSPANIPPVDRKTNIRIICVLFEELNRSFSCNLGPGVNLERTDDGKEVGAKE
jgi:hypothetical protein